MPTTPTRPAVVPSRQAVFSGMACLDTSGNGNIPALMETVAALSRATEPQEVLGEFSRGIALLEERQGYVSLSTRGLPPGHYRVTRMITDLDPSGLAKGDPWRETLPVHADGFFSEIIRQAYPEIIHHFHLKGDPVVGDALAGFGSLMAVPLFDDGEPLNWAIMLRREPEAYTVADLEETILRGNMVGTAVRNVIAAKKLREANRVIRREVEQIARIQRSLLPPELPEIPGLALGASHETFDLAGGDIYDFIPQRLGADGTTPDPHGPWEIQIADAAGHGPAAATVVAMLNAILSASRDEVRGPGDHLAFANRHLCTKRLDGTFVTAILARYDPATRELTYARAGHNPALLMTRTESGVTMRRLDAVGSIPLGVLEDVTFEETTIRLEPGHTLVLYTDGITEAVAPDGTMFEVDGIERSLTECSGEPTCVIGHIREAVRQHEAGGRPSDDQTIVVMRVESDGATERRSDEG